MDDQRRPGEPAYTGGESLSHIEELLRQEHYTPEEAAEVLNISQRTIFSAAYGGDLKATLVGSDIVSISRTDLVDWLRRRG